jgi:hypothetical protein
MTKYAPDWELDSIPDPALSSECARRNSLKRETFAGGRPIKLSPCPHCKKQFSARDLLAHKGGCYKNPRNKRPLQREP